MRPPPAVIGVLEAIPRPAHPALRWTRPEQWHVTLRFLGEADEGATAAGLAGLRHPVVNATLGPRPARLGSGTVVVPVAGLDGLAAAVATATAAIPTPEAGRPFRGHLTLARARRGRRAPPSATVTVEATWPVEAVELVRSRLDRAGASHETVATFGLSG